jgi:hypothetical protein
MAFKNLTVKTWEPWMTECVILYNAGNSASDLSLKYDITLEKISNILRSEKAKDITRKTQEHVLETVVEENQPKIKLIISKSIQAMLELVDDRILKETAPMAYWDQLRKTVETLTKINDPSLFAASQTQNITVQQNIQNVLSAGPDVLKRLRDGASLPQMEVAENVEYLGSPPPRESAGAIYGGGVDSSPNQSKNGLALLSSVSSDATRSGNHRLKV